VRLRETAFDVSPVAQWVVDANSSLVLANEYARSLFSLNARDLGRPLQDLEISYRPLDLRSLIEQAYAERRAVRLNDVERRMPDEGVQHYDVQVTPLQDNGGGTLGVSITFADVTHSHRLQDQLGAPIRSSSLFTRSSNRRTKSWKRPTKSSSPPTKS
jgi:two-component system CheB/CheR fusion protein